MNRMLRISIATILAILCTSPLAVAVTYPTRTVRIVVPYPAGGGVDALARALADRLTRSWKQPVSAKNKPGASTMIGGDAVAKAAPDGYTLLLTSDSSITSNPFLFPKANFDPVKDPA